MSDLTTGFSILVLVIFFTATMYARSYRCQMLESLSAFSKSGIPN